MSVAQAPAATGAVNAPPQQPEPDRRVDREGLLIGEFRLAADPVVDGDTIRVEGIEQSIRLLSIDTEEPLRSRADRAAATRDFEQYLSAKRGGATRPIKVGTPMGDTATEYARAFFEGAELVRLERDDPKEMRGRYGRPLAHAFAKKDGRWTSYNVECVRAGMSPYFTKYGYSHRFHNQLARAEAEAREAKRGIWSPDSQSYGDYEERKAWWNARADFIRDFEHDTSRVEDSIQLSHSDANARLEQAVGREAAVLGIIDRVRYFKTLIRVSLSGAEDSRFVLIFRDREVFERSRVGAHRGEPVVVRGVVERYVKGDYQTLQIVVSERDQVTLPSLPATLHETDPAPGR